MLNSGINPESVDNSGRTAFQIAEIARSSKDIFALLRQHQKPSAKKRSEGIQEKLQRLDQAMGKLKEKRELSERGETHHISQHDPVNPKVRKSQKQQPSQQRDTKVTSIETQELDKEFAQTAEEVLDLQEKHYDNVLQEETALIEEFKQTLDKPTCEVPQSKLTQDHLEIVRTKHENKSNQSNQENKENKEKEEKEEKEENKEKSQETPYTAEEFLEDWQETREAVKQESAKAKAIFATPLQPEEEAQRDQDQSKHIQSHGEQSKEAESKKAESKETQSKRLDPGIIIREKAKGLREIGQMH